MTTVLQYFITALSILLTGRVTGRTYQGRDGYDLQSGPVTYEAYYPNVNKIDDHQRLMEKSYQTSYQRYPYVDNINRNQVERDYITPYRSPPPAYVSQYGSSAERPSRTYLEDAIKLLIDAIRVERIDATSVGELYQEEPSNFQQAANVNVQDTEDIFKPRPQVIKYVFSRRVPEIVGDNEVIVRKDGDKVGTPQVASIEVSERPHKIRHHHGEKMRRNHTPPTST